MVAQWMSPSYAARTSSGRSSPESSFLTLFARVEAGNASINSAGGRSDTGRGRATRGKRASRSASLRER